MPRALRRLAAVLIAAPLALAAGCTSGGNPAPSPKPSFGALTAGQDVDRQLFFTVAQQAAEASPTFAFVTEVGDGGKVMKSTGVADNRDPKNRKRQINVSGAATPSFEMIITDGNVYTRTAGQAGGKWERTPLAARADSLLEGVSGHLSQDVDVASKITFVGEETVDGTKLRHFRVLVDPAKATTAPTATGSASASGTGSTKPANPATPTAVPSGSAPAGSGTATTGAAAGAEPIDYWLDETGRTRKMSHIIDGLPSVTTYSKWGEPVTISAPPADQVIAPSGSGTAGSGTGSTSAVPTTTAAPPKAS